MKGLREFMVCTNCLWAHAENDTVECGKDRVPKMTPAKYRCAEGAWAVDVNGSRQAIPVTAICMDPDTPAFVVPAPLPYEELKPAGIPDELKDKIKAFIKKENNGRSE